MVYNYNSVDGRVVIADDTRKTARNTNTIFVVINMTKMT